MARHTLQLTDTHKANILIQLQLIAVLAECISIEHQTDLVDTRFKNPAINQHSKRIKESAGAIQTHLASLAKNRDKDFFSYEYVTQVHRMFRHFIQMDLSQITEFMDGVEELQKEAESSQALKAS